MLVVAGHHAEHVSEVELRDAEDIEIWRYALEHQAVGSGEWSTLQLSQVLALIERGEDLIEIR